MSLHLLQVSPSPHLEQFSISSSPHLRVSGLLKIKIKIFISFITLANLFCLPCNDPIYGNVGCIGNCDGSNYLKDRNIMCNENDCAEGLYNLNGICFNCTDGLPNCKKCHSEINE